MKNTLPQDYRKELTNSNHHIPSQDLEINRNSTCNHTTSSQIPHYSNPSQNHNMLLLHSPQKQDFNSSSNCTISHLPHQQEEHHHHQHTTTSSSSSSSKAMNFPSTNFYDEEKNLQPSENFNHEEKFNTNTREEKREHDDHHQIDVAAEKDEEGGITDETTSSSSLNPSPLVVANDNNNSSATRTTRINDNNSSTIINERNLQLLFIDTTDNNLHLPLSPSTLSVSSSASVDDGTPTKLPNSTNCSPAATTTTTRPLSALFNGSTINNNNLLLSSTTSLWWREKLFPKGLLPNSTLAASSLQRASSSAMNFNVSLIDEEITFGTIAPSSLSSSRLDAVQQSSSSNESEFSEETLLEHTSKELCSNMSEEELEQISTPAVVDYILRELKFSKQKCTVVHLAAKHNRVELLQWFKRCCCDKKCSFKHMPISKLLNSDKSSSLVDSSFSVLENKRFSRNFGRNFNVAIRHFDSLDDDNTSQHSKQCQQRQQSLWSALDQYSSTPLFYSCKNSQSMEATAFLLSQPTVSQKQLNHHHDQFGNLPITIGFRSGNFKLCDLLVLFGAKIDVTSGILAESLLHKVCRDGADLEVVRYLAKNAPKVLLKRNQRDESALFACIRDLRTTIIPSTGGSFSSDISLFQNKKSSNGVSDTAFTLLHNILSSGSELFGRETFEKAVLMKNSFGMNILMTSILYNDVDAMKVICLGLSNYCKPAGANRVNTSQLSGDSSGSSSNGSEIVVDDISQLTSPRKRNSLRLRLHQRILSIDKRDNPTKNILKAIVFDKDKQGKTILHLIIEAAIQMEDNAALWDDLIDWFDGFKWLCLWLEQVFLQTINNRTNGEWNPDCGLCHFFEARDVQGYSPYGMVVAKQPNEEMNFMEKESTDDRVLFWPRVLEFIQTTIKKWAASEKIMDQSADHNSRNNFRYNAEVRGNRGFFNSESDSLDSLYAEQEDGILYKMKRRFKRTQSVDLDNK